MSNEKIAELMAILGNDIRISTLKLIAVEPRSFTDLLKHLSLESNSKLSFHLNDIKIIKNFSEIFGFLIYILLGNFALIVFFGAFSTIVIFGEIIILAPYAELCILIFIILLLVLVYLVPFYVFNFKTDNHEKNLQ